MRMLSKTLGSLAAAVCLLASPALAVKVGEKAPDFTLKGNDGKTYKLSELKGQTVILEWYNKECPYVKKHYESKNMQNLQQKFTSKGVKWFSVISSAPGKQGHADPGKATAIMKEVGSNATAMLLDENGKVGMSYGAKTTPHMYVIDTNGVLRYQGAIDDKPSTSPDSLKGAKPYLALAADAVLMNKDVAETSTKPYGCSVKY